MFYKETFVAVYVTAQDKLLDYSWHFSSSPYYAISLSVSSSLSSIAMYTPAVSSVATNTSMMVTLSLGPTLELNCCTRTGAMASSTLHRAGSVRGRELDSSTRHLHQLPLPLL